MKANYRRKASGELVAKLSISCSIDIEMIQKSICFLLQFDDKKITTKSVTDWIKGELMSDGLTWFNYGFYDLGYQITDDIVELSYQLFPSFNQQTPKK